MTKFKKGSILVMVAMLLLIALSLTACDNSEVLYVYNWGEYINMDVIKQFTEETGIKVKYSTYETNEDMYIKVANGKSRYDIVIPSDYMVDKLIKEDLLLPINYDNVPNAQYIDPQFMDLEHDPSSAYSVPYMWGTIGIVYNTTMVTEPVDSWSILWNPKYSQNILMLDSIRDVFSIAQCLLGYSVNTTDPAELEAVKKKLAEQRSLVRAWLVDKIISDMEANEAALGVTWSCDFLQMELRNPNLKYVIPKEGTNLWVDSMVILKNTKLKEEAEMFINFMCREDIALINSEELGNPTPQLQAKAKQPESILNNHAAYPTAEELARCQVFLYLGEDALKAYDRIWTELGMGQ